MSRGPTPGFAERRTYRRRRIADAARLLPVLGAALLALPLFWTVEGAPPVRTTFVFFYVFGVWAILVALSGVLSLFLRAEEDETPPVGKR